MASVANAESRALLVWFDRHRRDLPWRATRDPYRIWLSEVMLQQTRVETAQPYYERFLERFPTLESLAAAPVDEVLALWSGLGYYRRARQLHRAAQEVVKFGGEVPETIEGLQRLPGVGPYTAAAVASIAFGVPAPVLDGNVERVTSRLLAFAGDPKSSRGREILRARAAEILDPARPGDSNQALMELGATVCAARRPRCLLCPLRPGCQALAEGAVEHYPATRPRRRLEKVHAAMAVVRAEPAPAAGCEDSGDVKVLLFRRSDSSDLLAGTWELPWVETPAGGSTAAAVSRGLGRRYGGRWALARHRGRVRHGITFRSLEIDVWEGRIEPAAAPAAAEHGIADHGISDHSVAEGPEAGWFDAAERQRLPQSSLIEKVLRLAAVNPTPRHPSRHPRRG